MKKNYIFKLFEQTKNYLLCTVEIDKSNQMENLLFIIVSFMSHMHAY